MPTFRFVKGLPDAGEKQHNRYLVKTHAANSARWQGSAQPSKEPHQPRASRAAVHRRGNTFPHGSDLIERRNRMYADTAYVARCLHTSTILPMDGISILPQAETMSLLEQVYQLFRHEFVLNWGDPAEEAKKLMQFIVSDPGLLHSFLFSQQTRNQALVTESSSLVKRQTFACYAQAVERTNTRLSHPTEACNSASILCVLTLAVHGPITTLHDTLVPNQGPLGSLQNLHIYGGSVAIVPLHQNALHYMVRSRGGLRNLPPAIAQMISVADIISSSLNLKRPLGPYFGWPEEILENSLLSHRREDQALSGLGDGFEALRKTAYTRQDWQMVTERLSLYTMGVDDYLAARTQAHPTESLAEQRNFVQHSLLVMRSELDGERPSLLWLCIQAATIYSFLCLFPIRSAPFHRLAKAVKAYLSKYDLRQEWFDAPRLMTWVITMSAIAAIGLPERTWYVATLERCMRRTKIETWQAFRMLLLDFLWYPDTNDVDGEKLWNEIEHSVPFETTQEDASSNDILDSTA